MMNIMWKILIVFSLSISVSVCQDNEALRQRIHDFVDRVFQCRTLPALTLAVVRDGQVVTTRGWGRRDISLPPSDPLANVTEDTKFCIASLGKVHSATLLHKLMDEHAENPRFPFPVNWFTKVRDIMGDGFRLVDDLRTAEANIRDTVSHKLGIPYYSGAWWYSLDNLKDREEYCMRFGNLDSVYGYREYFSYSDMSYVLAGCIAEKLTDLPYEEAITEKLYRPLGMNSTLFPMEENDWRTFALPYSWDGERLVPINPKVMEDSFPGEVAGGHWSTARDMAIWMQLIINRGEYQGQRVVSAEAYNNILWPEFTKNADDGYYLPVMPYSWTTDYYGLGMDMGTYRGYRLQSHGGSWHGFSSRMSILPDNGVKVGIFTAVSGNSGSDQRLIHHFVTDIINGVPPYIDEFNPCNSFIDDEPDHTNIKPDPRAPPVSPSKHQKPAVDPNWRRTPDPYWSTPFEGQYGHPIFQNFTIWYDEVDEEGTLTYTLGRFGQGKLNQIGPTLFSITYGGYLSYSSTTNSVWFQNMDGDGLYEEVVNEDYQTSRPPVFRRGLLWANNEPSV